MIGCTVGSVAINHIFYYLCTSLLVLTNFQYRKIKMNIMKRNYVKFFKRGRNRILALLTLALTGMPFCADASFNFHLTDAQGKEIILPVDETLHFYIDDNSLVVSSSGEEITLAVDDLKGIKYNPDSAIEEVADDTLPSVRVSGHSIIITCRDGALNPRGFRLYDDNGVVVMQGECKGETVIDLASHVKGVHILCIENSPALKFMVK